jgi:hypothetical protein
MQCGWCRRCCGGIWVRDLVLRYCRLDFRGEATLPVASLDRQEALHFVRQGEKCL